MSSEDRAQQGEGAFRAVDARSRPAAPGLAARVRALVDAHPALVTWLVLAVGMVAILLWAARDGDLLFGQRLVLVLATVALAGLCAWIIGWEQ